MTAPSARVLFLPQNDSHAETVALLEPLLDDAGIGCRVLDMDGIYHQDTARYLGSIGVVPSGLATARPFYRLPPHEQVRLVMRARPRVRDWLADADAVIAFNDGALQRLVLSAARRTGRSTHLVLDGMVERRDPPRSLRSTVRRRLRSTGRRLEGRAIGALFPSELGLAAVDQIFVAGRRSAEVLRAQGSAAGRIIPAGLPRWPEPESAHPARVRRVLYLTGAFRWHDDAENALAQLADVRELAALCAESGLELVIRVHPRDDASEYGSIGAVIVDARSEPIAATIRASDLTLSFVSTGLFDSVILGKPTRVLAIHPRWETYPGSFVADPIFQAIRSVDALRDALRGYALRVDRRELEAQRTGSEPYVAATGREAGRRIVDGIAACIGDRIPSGQDKESQCES